MDKSLYIDLRGNKPITPEMIAAVTAAFELERRSGEDRRSVSRPHNHGQGRRAIDRMMPTNEDIERIGRYLGRV